MHSVPAITLKDICYAYCSGDQKTPVLHKVNLTVERGEMIAIQGPSGSGKSTFLYIMGCMLESDSGQVFIDGIEVSQLNHHQLALLRNQKLGFIFQHFHLLSRATVLENILLPYYYPSECATKLTKADVQRAMEYAKRLGLSERLEHLPNQLSGGEQQRVAIARALVRGAKIILADEPTGNLDSKTTETTLQLLEQLNEQGITLILITHEAEVAQRADRVCHFRDGCIQEVITNPPRSYHTDCSTTAIDLPENTLKMIQPKSKIRGWMTLLRQLFPIALNNILRNKMRSLLTMLGIMIGIAAVLAMVTLGEFTKQKIIDSYSKLGIETFYLQGYPNWQLRATDNIPIVFQSFDWQTDVLLLLRIFPQISALSPNLRGRNQAVSYSGRIIDDDVNVLGVSQHFLQVVDRSLESGQNFTSYHLSHNSAVCLIGQGIAQQLFDQRSPLGEIVQLNHNDGSYACKVIGVLEAVESQQQGVDENLTVLLPYTYFQTVISNWWENQIRRFLVKLKPGQEVTKVSQAIVNFYQKKYGKSGIFRADSNSLLLAQMQKFLSLFTLMLAVVALASLTVGGIGITNMMLVAVSERLKEIGLRKALGATNASMQWQFLLEAMIICCLAGIFGLLLGFAGYQTIIYVASKFVKQVDFVWLWETPAVLLAVISMLSVGILSGLIPALKAQRLQIITALRSE